MILKILDLKPEGKAKHVVIPASLKKVIRDDADVVVRDNDRDHVAYLGFVDDQIYFDETSEDIKQRRMSEAIGLKEYIEKYETKENISDLIVEGEQKMDLKNFMGIADYDAVCLARETDYTFVCAEVPGMYLAGSPDVQIHTICIVDFLNDMCTTPEELFGYIEKLISCRFVLPVTDSVLLRVADAYDHCTEAEMDALLKRWAQILELPLADKEYRMTLCGIFREILNQTKDKIGEEHPVWSVLLYSAMKSIGYGVFSAK